MTDAFGPPIAYNNWESCVEATSFVTQPVTENTWYYSSGDFSTTLTLTSEAQMSYLILAAHDVKISVTEVEYLEFS